MIEITKSYIPVVACFVKHLGQWFGGGQEAISYKNSEINT